MNGVKGAAVLLYIACECESKPGGKSDGKLDFTQESKPTFKP